MIQMNHCPGGCITKTLVIILTLLVTAAISPAAEFELAWDPNCNDYPGLIGYNLYYKEDASILDNPDDSVLIYIALTDEGFDPDNPSYLISDLQDNAQYFFTITAVYEDGESAMSNEISGINSEIAPPPDSNDSNLNPRENSASSGTSSGGCFIDTIN